MMQSLDQTVQLLMIATFMICAALMLIKMTKIDMKEQKRFFLGLFGFCLAWSLLELFFFLSPSYAINPDLYSIMWKTAYSFGVVALLSLLIVIESYIVKTRYVFSIITLIGLVLIIVLPMPASAIEGARLMGYIFLPAGAVSILALYIYLIIKLSGKMRRETSQIFIGFFLIFGGYSLDSNLFGPLSSMFPWWDILCSVMMLVGGLLVAITYYRREI